MQVTEERPTTAVVIVRVQCDRCGVETDPSLDGTCEDGLRVTLDGGHGAYFDDCLHFDLCVTCSMAVIELLLETKPAVSDDLVTATARATRLIGRYGEDPFVEALRERGYSIELDLEDD